MDYYYPMEAEEVHHPWQWQWRMLALLSSGTALSPATALPPRHQPNHVNWEETAAAHLFSANLPGVRKEDIRVEVEDARYLVIRTELDAAAQQEEEERRSFARKFRLPGMVDADGISAEYAHGVLTVTVPRMHTRLRPAVGLLAGAGGTDRDSAAPAA
ncbi:hypothetical protein EJB05_12262 [Eragrostis curvula]|uniref:SHSP domain-containing protein n=1 Tax=Eragrostis curvula TaxID=38414 RepID=A0A5J9VTB0_9POAL|nr:hypothetical protein EJB05_12262 [Eragrostis curvula]